MHLPLRSLPTETVLFDSNLSPAHIFRDLHAQDKPRYRNQLLDSDDDDVTFLDFVAGWVALAHDHSVDVTEHFQNPYSASHIAATSNGLGSCGVQCPAYLLDDDVVRPMDIGNRPKLTTTISPAGSITDPHIDGTGSGAFLFQLFGTKLLFTWPASSENLEWMNTQHGIKKGPLKLSQAIEEMSQMCVTGLTSHQGVILDPGMIHAVMSPNNSAIAGWDFVNATWMDSGDVERQMLWEAGLARKQKSGMLGDVYSLSRYLEEDLVLWDLLAKTNEKRRDSIQAMINKVRDAM